MRTVRPPGWTDHVYELRTPSPSSVQYRDLSVFERVFLTLLLRDPWLKVYLSMAYAAVPLGGAFVRVILAILLCLPWHSLTCSRCTESCMDVTRLKGIPTSRDLL